MSWEHNISCDGCSSVIGCGSHRDCLDVLRGEDGRAFMIGPKQGTWVELDDARDWLHSATRHRYPSARGAAMTPPSPSPSVPEKGGGVMRQTPEPKIKRVEARWPDEAADLIYHPDGEYVRYEDHLAVLGEAEADRDKYRQYFETIESHIRFYEDETRKNLAAKQASEEKLQGLREAGRAALKEFDEIGDYEAPVHVLREFCDPVEEGSA
jgi:hypothetical protein